MSEGELSAARERMELYRRLDRVVDFWTPIEPETADYHMVNFFIHYDDLEQLRSDVEIAEAVMEERLSERSAE